MISSYLSVAASALVIREQEHCKATGRQMPLGLEDLPRRFRPGHRLSLGSGIRRAISLLTREGWLPGSGLLHTRYPGGRSIATAVFEGVTDETTLGLYHSRPHDQPVLTLEDREFINRGAIRLLLGTHPELSTRIRIAWDVSLNSFAILESVNSLPRFEDAIRWVRRLRS